MLLDTVRNLINDKANKNIEVFRYTNSKIFTLSQPNIVPQSIEIYKNESSDKISNFIFDPVYSKLIIKEDLNSNDLLTVYYTSFKYSDYELFLYIQNALVYLSIYKNINYTLNEDKIFDENNNEVSSLKILRLIALITSILILDKGIKSYRTPEISIVFSDDLSKEDKIRSLLSMYENIIGFLDYAPLIE